MFERARHLLDGLRTTEPSNLFHYTSGFGLHGILHDGALRGSNFSFMNDRSEFTYGIQLLQTLVKQRLSETSDELERRFCERILTSNVATDVDVYLTCFCEKGDLLSQWRGYGSPNARYCICFDPTGFSKTRDDVSPILHVVYNQDRQREILDFVFREHLAGLRSACSVVVTGNDVIDDTVQCLYNCSLVPLAFFKDASFEEEDEWRCVAIAHSSDFTSCIDFGSIDGMMKPNLPLLRGTTTGRLPIKHVIAGASRWPNQSEKSAALMLARFEYGNVAVKPSRIPLSG